jgi:oligopeptide/dipeptide ABC transporter ATP-binding protein
MAEPRRRVGEAGQRLLEVRGLKTSFHTSDGVVQAVTGVDFHVNRGEVMGLVGESGCGKSVTSLSIMRLIAPPGRIEAGEVLFDGRDLLGLSDNEMRRLRGDRISMIFQQPTSSLNPVYDVGMQLGEVFELHRGMKRKAARARAEELLEMVGIPDPRRRLEAFPHELSGGMAQRVMIAMALAMEPELLIADEPTTALDVTIQAEILNLLRQLKHDFGLSLLLITHDLGVVAHTADRVAVMYAGRIVEQAPVRALFKTPAHPYTQALLRAMPGSTHSARRLEPIEGQVPPLQRMPPGCAFAPRCAWHHEACDVEPPPMYPVADGHGARCVLVKEAQRIASDSAANLRSE